MRISKRVDHAFDFLFLFFLYGFAVVCLGINLLLGFACVVGGHYFLGLAIVLAFSLFNLWILRLARRFDHETRY